MEHSWKNVPKLGFGLMRLPMLGDKVDIEQFKIMADRFLEAGFTSFDTAYGYINGQSEAAFKEAVIKRHPRDSFTIATKLPAWAGPKTAEEAKVAVRSIRRDAMEQIKKLKKNSEITEDDQRDAEEDLQKITDRAIKDVDAILAAKEKEIMEV